MKATRQGIALITIISFSALFVPRTAKAQSIPQLIEQLVLDKEKLSELKTILQDMYNSYKIIDQGYTNIKNIVQGNFNLHKAFLDGLLAVSPTVRNYARVVDIIDAEATIVSEYHSAYSRFAAGGHFTADELNYINNIYSTLFDRSINCLNELTMVITDDELRMSDADRLRAIDGIYTTITGQLGLLRTFNGDTGILELQRTKQAADIGALNNIYGIHN
jgi:hypothetical protein